MKKWQDNPKTSYDLVQVNSLSDVVKSENPPLAVIRKQFGEHGDLILRAMLNVFIIDVVTFFNVGKQMNPAQVAATSQLLATKYYFLKPDDFKLCFTNAKAGYYDGGKLYDRIDGQILCMWLNEYCNERAEYFESENIGKHNEHLTKEKTKSTCLDAEIREQWTKVRENLEADINREHEYEKFRKEYISKQTEPTNTNEDAKNI